MNSKLKLYCLAIVGCFCTLSLAAQECKQEYKKELKSKKWNVDFEDDFTSNWQNNWFLDGEKATLTHCKDGLDFSAGPVNRQDEHHAVLWTKESFEGDIKIEYDYTRTDSQVVNVNILYIQAEGIGNEGRGKDISSWNAYRTVPSMWKYYYNMNPLHISYSAFPMVNEDPENDYIRVRKYPAAEGEFKKTEVPPASFKTGFFKTGVTYHITVVKNKTKLYFNVEGPEKEQLYTWDLNDGQSPQRGRIGLRHMYTRSAKYNNFKVYTK